MIKFMAKGVTVLRLQDEEDDDGHILPIECFVKIPDKIPVMFQDHNGDSLVGYATAERLRNEIIAELAITSTMKSGTKALALIQKLYPALSFEVIDAYEQVLLAIEIRSIYLTPAGNLDPEIEPLGEKVFCTTARTDLH